jgi:hypothetical protein
MKIFVSKSGKQYGPYDKKQLGEYIRKGVFALSDLACYDGQNWIPISQVLAMPKVPHKGNTASVVPKPKKKMGCVGVLVAAFLGITCLGIFAAVIASLTDGDSNDPPSKEDESAGSPSLECDTSKAVGYRVLDDIDNDDVDFSFAGRKRLAFDITSNAAEKESKAQTVMLAAFELHRKFGGDVMNARLVEYKGQKGIPPAMANYSPDGGGLSGDEVGQVWDVMVNGNKYQPKPK